MSKESDVSKEMRGIQILGITGCLFGAFMYLVPGAILFWVLGLLGMVAVWVLFMWLVAPWILEGLEGWFGE